MMSFGASRTVFTASLVRRLFSSPATITVDIKKCKTFLLDEDALPKKQTCTKAEALDMYYKMKSIRMMEFESSKLYQEKVIRGFCHLSSGQEAVNVGTHEALRPTDSLITAYRAHGWTYLRGRTVAEVLCELAGKRTGAAKGKGGSMHMYAPHYYGGNGIVGAQGPLGTGAAFAHKYRGDGGLCLTLYGDGAANQGQLFEAYNMASLWKLPVIYMCENNGYGMGTSLSRASACVDLYTRAGFIPGIQVDGNCLLTTKAIATFAADWCRSGKGPILLEMCTYRFFGHSMSDPGISYRTRAELDEARETNDPISRFGQLVTSAKLVTEDELDEINTRVKVEVGKAVEAAINDPVPPEEDIALHVLCGGLDRGESARGSDMFTWHVSNK